MNGSNKVAAQRNKCNIAGGPSTKGMLLHMLINRVVCFVRSNAYIEVSVFVVFSPCVFPFEKTASKILNPPFLTITETDRYC